MHKTTYLVAAAALCAPLGSPCARADVREAAKRVLPATVAVEWHGSSQPSAAKPAEPKATATPVPPGGANDPSLAALAKLWTPSAPRPDAAHLASGTLISADGLIVTATFATGKGRFTVTFDDGRTLAARLLVDDHRTGLQLIQAEAKDAPHVELAAAEAEVGQDVVAAFCTDLRDRAIARGIVTARQRSTPAIAADLLQTDVRVERMSAGAPLADSSGRLLGIVVATSREGKPSGPTLAVPTEHVKRLLAARRGSQTVVIRRGYVGIQLGSGAAGEPVVVSKVLPDSPAAESGLREGDVISAINGNEVTSGDFTRRVAQHVPGDRIVLKVRRQGAELQVTLKLGVQPEALADRARVWEVPLGNVPNAGMTKYGAGAMRPNSFIFADKTGKLYQWDEEQAQSFLSDLANTTAPAAGAVPPQPSLAAPVIRVERSELDKKLDSLSAEVQALRDQVTALTTELKKLRQALPQEQR